MGLDLAGMATGDGDDAGRDDQPTWHYPMGQFMDRFHAGDQPGLVMVQVSGQCLHAENWPSGESILVKPPALLFKDPAVSMQLHVEYPAAGHEAMADLGQPLPVATPVGPGRVGLQSCYDRVDDPGTDFRDLSPHTDHLWT